MIQPNGSISKECFFFSQRHKRKMRDIAEDDSRIFFSSKELFLSTKRTIGKTDCNKLLKPKILKSLKQANVLVCHKLYFTLILFSKFVTLNF